MKLFHSFIFFLCISFSCTALERLSINTQELTSEHVHEIVSNQDVLEELDLSAYANPSKVDLTPLEKCSFPYLRKLKFKLGIRDFSVSKGFDLTWVLPMFSTMKKLEELELYRGFNESVLMVLKDLPIKNLTLRDNYIWVNFDEFRGLEKLTFEWSEPKKAFLTGFSFFDGFPKSLKSLSMAFFTFSSENVEQTYYATFDKLEELILENTNSKGIRFSVLCPNLRRLSLSHSNVSGGDVNEISKLQSLEYLDLSFTKVSGGNIHKLAQIPTLKILNLNETNMSKADFSTLQSLKVLMLSSEISLESFYSLFNLTQLEELQFYPRNYNITKAHIQELREALPNCKISYPGFLTY